MIPTEEIWRRRLIMLYRLLCLVLLLAPRGGGAESASSNFTVIGSTYVRAGGNASLTCTGDSYQGHAPFKWVRTAKVIPGQTNRTLNLRNVTKQDYGYYQCGIADSAIDGEGRHLHVFAVGDTLPAPSIDHPGVPVCGRNFTLQCTFLENYVASGDTVYTWFKDNKEIKGQSFQTLYFPMVADTDKGDYTCTAWEGYKNTTSPKSNVFQLTPLVSPKVTINRLPPKAHIKGIRGENLTLNCEVTEALPSVSADGYTWSFSSSSDGQNRSLGGRGNSLTLGPLTTADSGRYCCEATSNRVFELTLTGQASVIVEVVYLANLTLTSDQKVNEGDRVTLTCRVDSHPPASLAWTVSGREVRHVTDNVDHYVIMSAACSDSNNYTCAASNTEMPGRDIHASVQLTVLCRQATMKIHTTESLTTESLTTESLTTAAVFGTGQANVESAEKAWITAVVILSVLLGVGVLTAVVGVLYWHRQNDKWGKMNFTKMNRSAGPPQRTMSSGTCSPQAREEDQTVVEMGNVSAEESRCPGENSPLLGEPEAIQGRDPDKETSQTHGGGSASKQHHDPDSDQTSRETSEPSERRVTSNQPLDVGEKVGIKVQVPPQQRSKSDRRLAPPLQGQRIHFEDVYQNGKIYALPPLQDSMTRQLVAVEDKSPDDKDTERKESKTTVIKRLFNGLSKTIRKGDSPVFLFTQSLPCHVHAIIYHRVYGVIIVEAYTPPEKATRSELRQPTKDLREARERLRSELQGLLLYDGVTLLLALPNVEGPGDLSEKDKEWLRGKNIQVLWGTKESPNQTWLQTLFTSTPTEPWGLDGNGDQAFKLAVSKYLSMAGFSGDGDPPSWLLTPEQASVLHCSDKLVHVWGPPGSGKTLLLLDRVRRWLLRGKTVVVAVCGSSYELLLHRLGRMAISGVSDDTAGKVTFCTNVKLLKRTMESLGKGKNPSRICVAIDAIEVQFLPALLDACRSSTLDSAWTTSRADFPQAEEFGNLGGRRVRLPHTLRCSGPMLQLANNLLPRRANTAACRAFPHVSASLPPTLVYIQRHADHHVPASPVDFDCGKCDKWLTGVLSPQRTSPVPDLEQWKRWVVLLTGDWGSDSKQLTEKLVEWLTRQGVPAVHEWQPDRHVSNLSVSSLRSSDGGSPDKEDRAATRARVETSEDKDGRPAVHVMRGSLFRGLEKSCVLVVHYDWRDEHPHHQSQEKREARLSQHQYQLFRAATRCRTTLAVLLLSPSPAAAVLQHTLG